MKGLELPMNTLIVLILALLVFTAVAFFFLSGQRDTPGDQYDFLSSCRNLRCSDTVTNARIAAELPSSNLKFLAACEKLYPETNGMPEACMKQCGCAMRATPSSVNNAVNAFLQNVQEHQGGE